MKKSSVIFIVIIIILIIALGFMTYSRFRWVNAWKDAVNDIIKINGSLENAGVAVLFSQSGDSKVVIREQNNVVLEQDLDEPLPF